MPRTKQSAKRSTGASAPHLDIKSSALKASKKATVTQKTGLLTRSRSRTHPTPQTPQNSIRFITQPDVPVHVLTVLVQGPVNEMADMDKHHDEVACPVLFYYTIESLFVYSGAPLVKTVVIAFAVTLVCVLSVPDA